MNVDIIKNKKTRGALARKYIKRALSNQKHSMYTASDVRLAIKLNVSRLTIFNIRNEMNLKSRKNRIIDLIRHLDTSTFTIKELADRCLSKYQNMYKLVKSLKVQTRPDKPPIESMLEHRRKN